MALKQFNPYFGGTLIKQNSGYIEREYIHWRSEIPEEALKSFWGFLFGLGTKINLAQYLSAIPKFHYQRNLGEEDSYQLFFSLGITYGE